jgi:transposase
MSGGYQKAIRAALPTARVAVDPFHVVALAGRAVDDVRRAEWNAKGKSKTPEGRWLKNVRFALRKAPEHLTDRQRVVLAQLQQTNARLFRAYLLKEQLRMLYHLDDPAQAPEHLDAWLAWASRSKLKPFIRLARTLRRYRDGILAAITLGLTNARLEGLHSKVRLLSHRSFGFHSAAPLIALIYLCCAGISISPPLL